MNTTYMVTLTDNTIAMRVGKQGEFRMICEEHWLLIIDATTNKTVMAFPTRAVMSVKTIETAAPITNE